MIRSILLAAMIAAPMLAQNDSPRVIDVTKLVMVTPLTESPFEGAILLMRRNGDFTIAKLSAIKPAVAGKISIPQSAIMVDCFTAPLVLSKSYKSASGTHTVTVTAEDGDTRADCQKALDTAVARMKESWPETAAPK